MFKLVKILGSNSNVPEIISVPAAGNVHFRPGLAYFFYEDNFLSIEDPSNFDIYPKTLIFISVEDKLTKQLGDRVRGFFVNENMIFEPTLGENTTIYHPGNCYDFNYTEEDNTPESISSLKSDKLMVVDNDITQRSYPVKVIFNCCKKGPVEI